MGMEKTKLAFVTEEHVSFACRALVTTYRTEPLTGFLELMPAVWAGIGQDYT
jgi:hypothetical protein